MAQAAGMNTLIASSHMALWTYRVSTLSVSTGTKTLLDTLVHLAVVCQAGSFATMVAETLRQTR